LEHDINLLARNCVKFNVDGADIVQKANDLVSRLLSIVQGNEQAGSSSSSRAHHHKVASSSSSSSSSQTGPAKIKLTLRSPSKSPVNAKANQAADGDDDDDEDDSYHKDDGNNEDKDDSGAEQFGSRRFSSRAGGKNRFQAAVESQDERQRNQKPATRMRLVMAHSASPTIGSRGGRKRGRSAEESPDDNDDEDEHSDEDESENDDDDEAFGSKRNRTTSKRLATKKRVSYVDKNEDEDEDEDEVSRSRKTSSRHTSSTRPSSRRQESSQSSTSSRSARSAPKNAAPVQPASSRHPVRLDRDLLSRMNQLVTKIEESDVGGSFAEPVLEEDAPSYYEIIQQPMDLSTIK